jgi:hypothetical protein
MATHTVQLTIDDTTFQTARNRASLEGKALDQVVAEFLLQYAEGASAGAPRLILCNGVILWVVLRLKSMEMRPSIP